MNKDKENGGLPQQQNNKGKGPRFNFSWLYIILCGVFIAMYFFNGKETGGREISYSDFQECLDSGYVQKILINKDKLTLTFSPNEEGNKFIFGSADVDSKKPVKVEFGSIDNLETYIADKKAEGRFSGKINYEQSDDLFLNILWNLGPIILIVIFWIVIMRNMGGGGIGGGIFGFGKSKAKLIDGNDKNTPKILFKDVAGQAEAKREVHEIVDFLKNPKKYTELGGKIPKGALLVGPPGTGKTLLAKAVAGEAGVPFFSMSGSDFVEMFVGVGASRVRDLFTQAKQKAPCIVFIDEIDTIGRARGKSLSMGGGNDEREGTLNQLLAEMDGFGSNSGVIVLAATNRSEILDPALLRAGRFDRQIHVDLPDLNERKEIFNVHLQPIKIDETVDVDMLSRQTPGFSGADIANVCNEAALIAARHNSTWVSKKYFLDAIDRIIGGLEKKTKIMTQEEKRAIALHEAGHATVSWFCQYANPLVKVTIVPRGQALGAAWYMPEERQITTKEEIMDEICATLGGRAAEEICLGRISTGAMNDLEKTTKRTLGMILYAGMGESLPNLCYYSNHEYEMTKPYSEHTAQLIDEEVKKFINEQYARAKKILNEHKEGHAQLAQLLIDREVIFAEDVEKIFGKRPWVSRTEELLAANEIATKEDKNRDTSDHSDENAQIIRQKAIDAIVEKAKNGEAIEEKKEEAVAEVKNELPEEPNAETDKDKTGDNKDDKPKQEEQKSLFGW